MRWLRGKTDALRKAGDMRFLDGKKSVIVTVCFVVSGFVALLTGQDVGQWIDMLLRAVGWSDPATIDAAKETATGLVPLLFAVWAAVSALSKWWKQYQAGAKPLELGTPVGVVKAALSAGVIVDGSTGDPLGDAAGPASARPTGVSKTGSVVVVQAVPSR